MAGEALSNGVKIEVETTVAGVFVQLGGAQGFQLPGLLRETIDVTALDSTAREYIASLPDSGETSFTLFLRKGVSGTDFEAGQQRMEDLAGGDDIVGFKITLPTALGGGVYSCDGIVLSFRPTVQTNEAITAECAVRWTGAVTKA